MLIKHRTFRLCHNGGNLGRIQVVGSEVTYYTHMRMVPPVKKKHFASTSTIQEVTRHRKGESPTTVGGPKKMEHILRGGINDANNFKVMQTVQGYKRQSSS
jgi:hypothetical protein